MMKIIVSEPDLRASIETKRPLVILFYSDWCPASRITKVHFDDISNQFFEVIDFIKVPLEMAEEIAYRAKIQAIPTIIFFTGGKAISRLVGERTYNELSCVIRNFVAQVKPSLASLTKLT